METLNMLRVKLKLAFIDNVRKTFYAFFLHTKTMFSILFVLSYLCYTQLGYISIFASFFMMILYFILIGINTKKGMKLRALILFKHFKMMKKYNENEKRFDRISELYTLKNVDRLYMGGKEQDVLRAKINVLNKKVYLTIAKIEKDQNESDRLKKDLDRVMKVNKGKNISDPFLKFLMEEK